MRVLIVTAANENFFVLIEGLLRSLYQWKRRPFTDIGVFDLGLKADSREWIAQAARHIVIPGWDLPVAESLRQLMPERRAMTARPFIPQYFPGYDIYVWLDADTWVQERSAVELAIAAAAEGRLAGVPEAHPLYREPVECIRWKQDSMQLMYGDEAVKQARWDAYLNSGVLAMRGDAPHWAAWQQYFRIGLEKAPGTQIEDQSPLNHALWNERLPVTLLPARCNWLCHMAMPRFDPESRKFCEPDGEGKPLGIVHLTWKSKNLKLDLGPGNPDDLRFPRERKQAS